MSSPTSGRPRGRPPYPLLTPAEERVLKHLRHGLTNAEIASRLGVSLDAVKYHVSNMLGKLDLENRDQLAAWRGPSRLSRIWAGVAGLGWKAVGAGAAGLVAVVAVSAGLLGFFGGQNADEPLAFNPEDLFVGTVSMGMNGEPADGPSSNPSISGDGRLVAFESEATNLVPNDTNGVSDIFVFDRLAEETRRVSVGMNGQEANGPSYRPSISEDGKWVAFDSQASNLVPDDVNGELDRALLALPEEQRERYGRPDPDSGGPQIPDLVALWAGSDVFVVNLETNRSEIVSITSGGEQGNLSSLNPSISRDGQFVAFESTAPNLVGLPQARGGPPGGLSMLAPGADRVFLWDRKAGTTMLVSKKQNGEAAEFGSGWAAITPDGSRLVFLSRQTDLTGESRVWAGSRGRFLWGRKDDTIARVPWPFPPGSGSEDRLVGFEGSGGAISPDGKSVAFATSVHAAPSTPSGSAAEVSGLFVWTHGEDTPTAVPGTEGQPVIAAVNFDFLNDTELVFSRPIDPNYSSSWALYVYDLESGETKSLPGPGNIWLPRASADGRSITAMQIGVRAREERQIVVFSRW